MRLNLLFGWVALAAAASCLSAAPAVNLGTYTLAADTSGQTIQVLVSGSDLVTGFNLRAQMGDGTGPGLEPVFQAVSFTGGIWDAYANTVVGGPVGGAPQFAQASVVFNNPVNVTANGQLVTLTLDTTGLFSGTYGLLLKGTQIGSDSDFIVIGGGTLSPSITNGTITVVATSTAWKASPGNWSDPACWSAGEPNQSLEAVITNGGTATITQAGEACSTLTLGRSLGQSGTVSMTGGALNSNIAYVGYAGTGTFTQTDGNHCVQQALSIAAEGNSVGAYNLKGGTLLAGRIDVGGSSGGKGGTGTFAVSGGHAVLSDKLVVWSGGTASLGLGTLVSADANHPAVDLVNDGMLDVGDGNGSPVVFCLGNVTGSGNIEIGPGATLWAASLMQNSVQIDAGGTLVLASEDPQLYATIARQDYELAVPEPGCMALIGLGGLWLAGFRRRRARAS